MKGGYLTGQVAIVTGSARGIGKSIARALGKEGAHVVIADVDGPGGKGTTGELRQQGLSVAFLLVDLSRKGGSRRMIREVVRKMGRVDILVNNACSVERHPFLEETEQSWDTGMSVALKAAFFASQEAIRAMAKKGGGSIVNISSIAATLACHESVVYHIAKAGLEQMTRVLASVAGPHGVRVNSVCPGFIVQDEHRSRYSRRANRHYRILAESCHPMGRVGTADDVARAALFLCSSAAAFITGHSLIVDGGATLQEQFSLIRRSDRSRKK